MKLTKRDDVATIGPAETTDRPLAFNAGGIGAKEGEVLPAPPPPYYAHMEWGGDDDEAAQPAAQPARPAGVRLVAGSAPVGWLRDLDRNLWDTGSVSGLEVVHEHYDGVARFKVVARTPCGPKTLFLEADGRGYPVERAHPSPMESAEAYRDRMAARISALRGHYQDDEHEDC